MFQKKITYIDISGMDNVELLDAIHAYKSIGYSLELIYKDIETELLHNNKYLVVNNKGIIYLE